MSIKIKHKKIPIVLASLGIGLLMPLMAYAATDSQNSTINANLGSTISVSTSGTVTINITPVSGGSQTSASDSVGVSTNNSNGYTLTLSDSNSSTDLVNGANSIVAHSGTQASPTALANNSWGYAVPSIGGFDASYSIITNATSSSSKWAGVPTNASPNTIKTTSTTATNDTTIIWYGVKADTTKPNGTYTDTVTYTATTNT